MGGVFSHAVGFTSLDQLWGGIAFHTVSMSLAVVCFGLAARSRKPAVAQN